MQLFEYSLIRIAGLPFDMLEQYRDIADIARGYTQLQQDIQHPTLQAALPYSSQDFLQHLPRFLDKNPLDFRKKEFQKARTALKYLTRTAAKCSPLADFTTLGMIDWKQSKTLEANTKRRINLELLDFFAQQLIENEQLRKKITIRKNPTLHRQAMEWCWILNIENQEHLQRADEDELINALLDFITINKNCTFAKAQNHFFQLTGSKAKQWKAYFEQLFEVGILSFVMPFGKNQHGFVELHHWLQKIDSQDNTYILLQQSVDFLLKNTTDTAEANLVEWTKYCAYFNQAEARFRPESIFFKDVAALPDTIFEKVEKWQPALEKQAALYGILAKALCPLYYDKMKDKIIGFLAKADCSEPLSIFELYEGVFHQSNELSQNTAQLIAQNRQDTEIWLSQNVDFQENTIFLHKQTLLDFYDFTSKMASQDLVQLAQTANLVVQPSADGSAVLNGASMGNGKQFLRFLHLFDNEIAKDFQVEDTPDLMYLTLDDASLISANEHLPVTTFALSAPNSLASPPNISLLDMEICKSDKNDFYLRHSLSQKRILPLDLGLEHPRRRSPSYQLLMAFGESLVDFRICNNLINNVFEEKIPTCTHYPRIALVADDKKNTPLYLQRKHWFFDIAHLPKLSKATSKMAYFEQIKAWAAAKNLPNDVFVSVPFEMNQEDENEERLRPDDYKPQYIDFQNPLLVDLFGKILNRVPEVIKIEEMLPAAAQLMSFDGKRQVLEIVLQTSIILPTNKQL
jgi:lantibiotic biosynthesis protein